MVRRSAEVFSFPRRGPSSTRQLLLHVFREHEPQLRRFLHARGATRSDCDDLVQEAFLRLARQSDLEARLSSSPEKIRAYLIVVVSNLVFDMRRRSLTRHHACHESADEVTLIDGRPTPEQAIATQQALSAVQAVLAELDPRCSQAFRLSRFEDLGYEEIARRLNVSVSMIEKYVAKALVAVRSRVDFETAGR